MKKSALLTVMTLILITGMGVQGNGMALDREAAPKVEIREFYTWYIQLQSHLIYPLLDKGISKYVAQNTIDKLREAYRHDRLPGDVDYFTKVQDYDDRDWASHIKIYPETLFGDVAVVPVALGSRDKSNVAVFLQKQTDGWKIIKVDDTRGIH